MYASTSCRSRDVCSVDDEIADLTVEDVHRDPVEVGGIVGVAIDQTKTTEAGRGLEGRWAIGITDEQGKVIWNDRRGDGICPSRKIDNSRCRGRRSLVSISKFHHHRPYSQLQHSEAETIFSFR